MDKGYQLRVPLCCARRSAFELLTPASESRGVASISSRSDAGESGGAV